MEFCGLEIAQQIEGFVKEKGYSNMFHVSDNPEKHLRNFYTFADMQLGV